MKNSKKEMCPCGFPQSYPIPHEHDQTDREKVIIKHFEQQREDLLDAAKEILDDFNEWGEVLQLGDNGEYGMESAIGRLNTAIINAETVG